MKRVLVLLGVLTCMLLLVACDKATGSEKPVIDGEVSDLPEIDKNVSGETEQTQQAIVESVRGTITRIDEDKIYDLTEEEVKIIADIIENGTWAPSAARKMKEILSTMKDINVIDNVVTIKSSMKDDTVVAMKELAKEIVG